ncbi:type I-E CRISPR-associated endoribonuclease Cas2e [Bosea sp. RAC05]|uniref:type I-E CRISPR-associated endoribonuclease Cas2e n=1 Tax=Bosea sp. RAC05 TaxID=1842539 RepID=UPI0008589723|nr:type I-E CRISPR-associated endoribonuclease Cas2e [Bosea sp. RAC05]AOG02881.1 CRISPR-associated endoribonuclease Cas2, subtype I-E [Bosea sp. RAC05]
MTMTVFITRDVTDRFRGFLASIMPEVSPGVFTSPALPKGVRDRVWNVLSDWWSQVPGGSILMISKDDSSPGRLRILSLGTPVRDVVDLDGVLVGKRRRPNAAAP